MQHFWKRWQREYLTALRESHESKIGDKRRVPEEGDVVIVHEDGEKRGHWKMGVIEGLICGRDKEVRGARVKVLTKGRDVYLNRPVQKLYPIEVHAEPTAGKKADSNQVQEAAPERRLRPRRAAALDAARRISCIANQENY